MFYTKSNAARVLNVKVSHIVAMTGVGSSFAVQVKGQSGVTLVSQQSLMEAFVSFRQEGAKNLVVGAMAESFAVVNPAKGTAQMVVVSDTHVMCGCEDAVNQNEVLGQPGVCKHGYAVLNFMGCATLEEWVAKNAKAA